MKSLFLFAISAGVFLSSCSNDVDVSPEFQERSVTKSSTALHFSTQSEFDKTIQSLSELSKSELLEWASLRNHKSLLNVYTNALECAEDYYEREGGYEEFKGKYSTLYFPEQEDDYSAFLPCSSNALATVADSLGCVVIGNKTIDLRDALSYDIQNKLGRTANFSQTKVIADNNTIKGTNSIVESFNTSRDRKIWIKTDGQKYQNGIAHLQIEICFRKKGFLSKWYNYKSQSTVIGTGLKGFSNNSQYDKSKDENSSHDYYIARLPRKENSRVVYDRIQGVFSISHRGIDKNIILTIDHPSFFY